MNVPINNEEDEDIVIENIDSDIIRCEYDLLKVNGIERGEISDDISTMQNDLNVLKAKFRLLHAEKEIMYKKLWDEVYDIYPTLKDDYNKLRIKEGEKKSLCIVTIPDGPPGWLSFQ